MDLGSPSIQTIREKKNEDEIKREREFECERVFGVWWGFSESVSSGSVAKVVGLKKDDENDNEDEEKIIEEANRRSVWDQVEKVKRETQGMKEMRVDHRVF